MRIGSGGLANQHFASKSHLYVAILEEGGEQLIAAVVSTPQQGTPEQFLHGTFESFFGWVEEHPGHWRLIFRDAAADPVVAAAQTALFVRARRAIAGLFALTPSWALSSDVDQARAREMLAQLTMSALNGLAAWWWGNRDVPREQIVGTAMNLLWSGISALGRGGPFETEQAETKEDA